MLVFSSLPATHTPEYRRTFSLSDSTAGLSGKSTRGVSAWTTAAQRIAPSSCGITAGTRSSASAG